MKNKSHTNSWGWNTNFASYSSKKSDRYFPCRDTNGDGILVMLGALILGLIIFAAV